LIVQMGLKNEKSLTTSYKITDNFVSKTKNNTPRTLYPI